MRRAGVCMVAGLVAIAGCEKHSVTEPGGAPLPAETTGTAAAPAALPVETGAEATPASMASEPAAPRVDADVGPPRVDSPATTPAL